MSQQEDPKSNELIEAEQQDEAPVSPVLKRKSIADIQRIRERYQRRKLESSETQNVSPLTKIKKLEEMQKQKRSVVEMISVKQDIPLEQITKKPLQDCVSTSQGLSNIQNSTRIQGFTTASSQRLEISTKSLDQSINMLSDIMCPSKDINRENKDNFLSKKDTSSIFKDEDFSDLQLGDSFSAFKSASVLQNSKTKKNIFEGEDFADLKQNSSCGFTSALEIKLDVSKGERNIFEGENFDDLFSKQPKLEKPTTHFPKLFRSPLITPQAQNSTPNKRPFNQIDSPALTPIVKKRKLGMRFSSTLNVSQSALSKGKQLFSDIIDTSTPIRPVYKPDLCELTPIKAAATTDLGLKMSLNAPTEGDEAVWLENLRLERSILEEKLRVNGERMSLVREKRVLGDLRIKPGVLLQSKQNRTKKPLREYSIKTTSNSDDLLNQIKPENAHLVHFNINESISHVNTLDGVRLIPNMTNKVGLTEIEFGFNRLKAVQADLVPQGWIRNHFKWIVWKLASYDRKLEGDNNNGSLCLENVVQQLKYRYDLEIDHARRPALRRILELDESPQKRLVLCVSKIIKFALGKYELELTDGWYPIKTVPDQLLCDQVTKGTIRLGTKLLIYGAELVNCPGCYPLETPENVYLKINFNGTRRALWWCKLGVQKFAGAFPVSLSSVHLDGGRIGCVKCRILRVYPVKYMEKCGNRNVWRNQKAEEKEAENHHKNAHNFKDIRLVQNPEQLYDMLQRVQDVEGFQELLSDTQKNALYQYTTGKSFKAPKPARNVVAVLKMKITDGVKFFDFSLWRPGEEHLMEIKEGQAVTVYDVSCSPKWGLSSTKSTRFRRDDAAPKIDPKFQRTLTCIDLSTFEPFREFDTVGLVVKKTVKTMCQEIWLTDTSQNLLLVKIPEGPSSILVFDNVVEGDAVVLCNLHFRGVQKGHFVAHGDYAVLCTKYPKFAHLRAGLDEFNRLLEGLNKDELLQNCLKKVLKLNNPALDVDDMESSQITSTDMALVHCIDQLI